MDYKTQIIYSIRVGSEDSRGVTSKKHFEFNSWGDDASLCSGTLHKLGNHFPIYKINMNNCQLDTEDDRNLDIIKSVKDENNQSKRFKINGIPGKNTSAGRGLTSTDSVISFSTTTFY